jgi:hypothetical protein
MANMLLVAAFAATVCTSCSKDEPTPVQVSDVTLDKTTLTLIVGTSETLTATVMPDKTLTWTSSATAVVTLDASTGEVTAVALGAATITAAAGGKIAACAVTVTPPLDISIDVTPDGTNTFAFYATATRLTVDWGDGAIEEFTNIDIHTDAVTHTYANNEKRLVTIIAEGLTEFGDDITLSGGGATTHRSIAGSMEKISCSHCPDLKGLYILNNALTEADMSGAP